MTIAFRLDGALLPYQTVRLNGTGGGVAGLPSAAWYGEPVLASLQIEDPTGVLDIGGWHTFTVEETACVGHERIFTGWIFNKGVNRGVYRTGAGRVWDCEIIDQNALFSFEVFRASSAKRPAETDLVRAAFAIASAPMAGTPIYDNGQANFTDNPRNFGDANYIGQKPAELFMSITSTVGKNFYAYWDDTANQISLYYDLVGAMPASTLAISNVAADYNGTTVFAPAIDAELNRTPEDVYTGILFQYRGAYVYQRRQATMDAYSPTEFSPNEWRRDLSYSTDRVGLLSTATSLTTSMLEERAGESDTLRFMVQLPATKVNLLHAGMSVDVKFSHLPGYDTYQTVQVIRRVVVPTDGHDALYDVHIETTTGASPTPGGGGGDPGGLPFVPCAGSEVDVFDGAVGGPGAQYGVGTPNAWFDGDDTTIGFNFNGATTTWDAGDFVSVDRILIKWSYGTIHPGNGAAAGFQIGGNNLGEVGNPWDYVLIDPAPVTTAGASYPGDFEHEYTLASTVAYRYWTFASDGTGHNDIKTISAFGDCEDTPPDTGQPVPGDTPTGDVDGSNTDYVTPFPFADGSLVFLHDGLDQTNHVTSYDGFAGTFTLDYAPSTGSTLIVRYQGR